LNKEIRLKLLKYLKEKVEKYEQYNLSRAWREYVISKEKNDDFITKIYIFVGKTNVRLQKVTCRIVYEYNKRYENQTSPITTKYVSLIDYYSKIIVCENIKQVYEETLNLIS
jgi:hypothetical protein